MTSSDGYPHPTSAAASAVMRGNRRKDTRPERLLRSELHTLGLRFRVDHTIDTGNHRVRADIAFTRARVAVFVDGCFWHGCPQHGNTPRVNTNYWGPKLQRNLHRDQRNNRELEAEGWEVLRIWEHEDPAEVALRVRSAVLVQSPDGPPGASR